MCAMPLKKTPEGNSIFVALYNVDQTALNHTKITFCFPTQVKLYVSEVLFYKVRITCLYDYAVGSESPK